MCAPTDVRRCYLEGRNPPPLPFAGTPQPTLRWRSSPWSVVMILMWMERVSDVGPVWIHRDPSWNALFV